MKSILLRNKSVRPNHPPVNPRTLAKLVWAFITFSIGIILLVVILSDDGNSAGETNYYLTAEQYYNREAYDSAKKYYLRTLKLDPENAASWNGLGDIMLVATQYDSALYFYDKALAIDDQLVQASYSKGLVYYNKKNYDATVKIADAIVKKFPDYNDGYLLAGDAYYFQNKYNLAIPYYEVAYAHGVRSKALCHIMAYIYDQQGQHAKAIALYKEAITYDSSAIDVYQRLSELLPGKEGDVYRQRMPKAE